MKFSARIRFSATHKSSAKVVDALVPSACFKLRRTSPKTPTLATASNKGTTVFRIRGYGKSLEEACLPRTRTVLTLEYFSILRHTSKI